MDVDWSVLFKSFYAEVRMLITCKDMKKIPPQRTVEMNREIYMLYISVKENSNASGGNGLGDDPSVIVQTAAQNNGMETDPPNNDNGI